jgi:hypothetical protein
MSRSVSVETPTAENADFSRIIDRVLVFDDFFSNTQLLLLERWALQTPHWMLNNAVFAANGRMRHRIWGASYTRAWKEGGWSALPPTLFSSVAALFRGLKVMIEEVQYIGLNGQSRGQDASMHTDCIQDASNLMSILIYIGEDTNGDLQLFDKDDQQTLLHSVPFRPNRIVAFDGSIPHRALSPTNDSFRISAVVRGTYRCLEVGQRTD